MAQLEKGSPSKHLAVGRRFEVSKTISANLYVFLTPFATFLFTTFLFTVSCTAVKQLCFPLVLAL
jgi:hypothetical protein